MQRSISHKNSLIPFVYVGIFLLYSALTGIYLFLPPFFAVLFIFFSRALKRQDILFIILVSVCLVIFEAQNGYVLFSSIIYFSIIYKYIIPKISKISSCANCIKLTAVLLVYLGFFIFNSMLASIFLLPEPSINYYIIYYIIIEFFLVSII